MFKSSAPVAVPAVDHRWVIRVLGNILYFKSTREDDWHFKLQGKFDLHPAVDALIEQGYAPINPWSLVLEWPHMSEVDPSMLAYTQTDEKGQKNLQTRVKPGRYLAKAFPSAPDHAIRDAVSSTRTDYIITHDMEKMIDVVRNGPYSCMKNHGTKYHPYRVYDPDLGWGLAYLERDGKYLVRALVLDQDGNKCFVRTFEGDPDASTSSSSKGMEQWLEGQGYEHVGGWPEGARLRLLRDGMGRIVAPYIDGVLDKVDIGGDHLVLSEYGDLTLESQQGYVEDPEPAWTCDECGAGMGEDDDSNPVGQGDDSYVCDDCLNRCFSRVRGYSRFSSYSEYYVPDDLAIAVDGEDYDSQRLPEFIVQLDDGNYAHEDNVVNCDGDYYHIDECVKTHDGDYWVEWECVVLCAKSGDSGEWAKRSGCTNVEGCGWCLDDELGYCEFLERDWPEDDLVDVECVDGTDVYVSSENVEAFKLTDRYLQQSVIPA
jgi:hypothetical protein